MAVCLGFTVLFLYDGYLSKYEWSMRHSFYKEHVIDKGGKPDDTMVWNQKQLPVICIGIAILLGVRLLLIVNKKIVAEDTGLVIDGKINVAYDSIQKIDKTNFDSKGHFTLTYLGPDGKDIDRKISDRDYDDLRPILDHLVAKIS
jgi:hypothetical protein